MKKIILTLMLLTQPILLLAAPPLSRESITSFYAAFDKIDALANKYPQVFQRIDKFTAQENDKLIKYVKSTPAYPEFRSILSANGFSSVDDFFNFSQRIISSLYAVQTQKMTPEEKRQLEAMEKSFDENIKKMEQSDTPDNILAGMKAQLKEMQAQQRAMQQMAKNASKADIKFTSENFEWLISILPEEEENHDSEPTLE